MTTQPRKAESVSREAGHTPGPWRASDKAVLRALTCPDCLTVHEADESCAFTCAECGASMIQERHYLRCAGCGARREA